MALILQVVGGLIIFSFILIGVFGNCSIIYYFRKCTKLKSLLISPIIQQLAFFGLVQNVTFDILSLWAVFFGHHPGVDFPFLCSIHTTLGCVFPAGHWTISTIGITLLINWKSSWTNNEKRRFIRYFLIWACVVAALIAASPDLVSWFLIGFTRWSSKVTILVPNRYFFCQYNETYKLLGIFEMSLFIVGSLIPYTVTFVTYAFIMFFGLCHITNHLLNIRLTISIFMVFIAEFSSSLPFTLTLMMKPVINTEMAILITALGISNNAFNVFIYGFHCKTFRNAILKDFGALFHRKGTRRQHGQFELHGMRQL